MTVHDDYMALIRKGEQEAAAKLLVDSKVPQKETWGESYLRSLNAATANQIINRS